MNIPIKSTGRLSLKSKKRKFCFSFSIAPLLLSIILVLGFHQFHTSQKIYLRKEIFGLVNNPTTNAASMDHYDARLPRKPSRPVTKPTDKVLVVYSGPTDLLNLTIINDSTVTSTPDRKTELYRRNFEHFLMYGVQCKTQDTVVVVTDSVERRYRSQINQLNRLCQSFGHFVRLAIRNNTCLDLDTVRLVLHDGKSIGVDIDSYDYFVYANCGTTGPSRKWADLPWTDVFIEKLNDNVKMSGLTINCGGPIHIQSMVYALDRTAINIIRQSRAIFDCIEEPLPDQKLSHYIINRYERGMSREILSNNYGISPIINPIVFMEGNKSECDKYGDTYRDQWMTDKMKKDFGRVLDLEDTVFFKTSRLISKKTAEEIKFPLTHSWSW